MTNPNNALGTNGAYGGRTSVNALNDVLQVFDGRGILTGFQVKPGTGMQILIGGTALVRDVAIAQDSLGNYTTVNNISGAEIPLEIPAASATATTTHVVVVYVNNPPTVETTDLDNPGAVGICLAASDDDTTIRGAITSDGGTGSTAYYAILATLEIPAGTTQITDDMITPGHISTTIPAQSITNDQIAPGSILGSSLADDTITEEKIKLFQPGETITFSTSTFIAGGYITSNASTANFQIPLPKRLAPSVSDVTMVNSPRCTIRGIGGYVMQDTTINNANYSVTFNIDKGHNSSGTLRVTITRTAGGWPGATNNTPVALQIYAFTLRFN